MSVIYENSFYSLANRGVQAFRIIAFEPCSRENRFGIALLLGDGQAVLIELWPQSMVLFNAMLVISGQYTKTLRRDAVKHTDIAIRGSSAGCHTESSPQQTRFSVNDIVPLICEHANYRFMCIKGRFVGGASWVWQVMTSMSEAELLERDEALTNGTPSLLELLSQYWVANQAPQPCPAIHGLFIQSGVPFTIQHFRDSMAHADPRTVTHVIGTILRIHVDKDIPRLLTGLPVDIDTAIELVERFITQRDLEITRELFCQRTNNLEIIAAALEPYYPDTANQFRRAAKVHENRDEASLLLLAAVIDVSDPQR